MAVVLLWCNSEEKFTKKTNRAFIFFEKLLQLLYELFNEMMKLLFRNKKGDEFYFTYLVVIFLLKTNNMINCIASLSDPNGDK